MDDNESKTLDLGEAAALLATGFNLLRLEPTNRERQRAFVYEEVHTTTGAKAPAVIHDYRRKKLQVDAYGFYLSVKELKSRLHDELELAGEE